MEEASGMNLGTFFRQWLYVAGQPELKIWKKVNRKSGNTTVYIQQKQDSLFDFSLDLQIRENYGARIETIDVKGRITKVNIPSVNIMDVTLDPDVKLLFKPAD